jgi:hypothetical protein
MIIALAGRRIDAPDATISRFPLRNVAAVRERLHAFFVDHKVTALVCSVACGADLLALDVAGELGIWRRIVFPFKQDRFRATSVVDRPGEWGTLFDRIIRDVQAEGKFVILSEDGEDDVIFATANKVILNEALLLAHEKSHEQPEKLVQAVLVWDGLPRGESDLTAHFASEALARGLAITEIATMYKD